MCSRSGMQDTMVIKLHVRLFSNSHLLISIGEVFPSFGQLPSIYHRAISFLITHSFKFLSKRYLVCNVNVPLMQFPWMTIDRDWKLNMILLNEKLLCILQSDSRKVCVWAFQLLILVSAMIQLQELPSLIYPGGRFSYLCFSYL